MDIYAVNDIARSLRATPTSEEASSSARAPTAKRPHRIFHHGSLGKQPQPLFTERDGVLYTEPFDASKVEDPSLIIYAAVRNYENKIIVTNGDQTDTINAALKSGGSFKSALETREFEPDAPNFTPRISGMLTFENKDFTYEMSILKSADARGQCVQQIHILLFPARRSRSFHPHLCLRRQPHSNFSGRAGESRYPERYRRVHAVTLERS